jgi:LPS export ABC transporter protein LptC
MNSTSLNQYNIIKSIVVLLGMTMLLSCENNIKEVQNLTNQEELPIQSGKNIEFIFTDSTRITYKAIASDFFEIKNKDENYFEFRKGGVIYSYDKNEKQVWKISCNFAINHVNDKLWELRNDVVAISDDNKTINSELMYWDQNKEIIYSDQYVRITTEDGQVLEGNSFTSDQDMNNIRLKNVTGEVYLEDKTEQ